MLTKSDNDGQNTVVSQSNGHKLRWWHWVVLVLLIVGTIYIARQEHGGDVQFRECEGQVFATSYHIKYQSSQDLHSGILNVLQEVDKSLSPFNKTSVISAVNNNQNPQLNKMFSEVFVIAQRVNAETSGAFDITVAPLVNAWGFGFKRGDTNINVDSLLTHVGMDKVRLEDNHIIKSDSAVMLDCSAIAKGYGVDAVGKYLEAKGVEHYMVEIGGEVRLKGLNDNKGKWRIGVNKPSLDSLQTNSEIQDVLELTDVSMATSGNYRNFYRRGGKIFAHTIDPRTGYPVQHNILSATVIATDCVVADAYATAFMVLGLDEAKEVLKRHKELKAYLICGDTDGKYFVYSNL